MMVGRRIRRSATSAEIIIKAVNPPTGAAWQADRTVALHTQANSIDNAEPPTPACRLSLHFF